jgi:heat shock protein HslJ
MRLIPLLLLATAVLAAAERPATGLAELTGAEWTLASFQAGTATRALPVAPRLGLQVEATGAASGQSAVNRWFGNLTVGADGTCALSGLGTTKMAGDPEAMGFESDYLRALRKVGRADRDGEVLILSGEGVRLVFHRGGGASLGATAPALSGPPVRR